MKNNLIALGHIIVIIIVYILSFLLPGAVINLFDFSERIDFFRTIIGSLLAIIFFIFCSKFYVERIMKLRLFSLRVKIKKPDIFWIFASLLVRSLVVLFYFVSDKAIIVQNNFDLHHTIHFLIRIVFISGLCAGIVEEILFRGILLGYLEKKYGLVSALIISSLLFGVPHLLNIDVFSISLIIQVTVFITLYGIIMSMIVYYTDNIWNSISIHIFWNVITSLIINQGEEIESNFVLQMKEKSLFWNGSDYGLEVSIVGLMGFSIFGFLVLILKKRNSKKIGTNQ